MSRRIERGMFSDVVIRAIDAAAGQAAGSRTIDTRDVLTALMTADMIGEWDRVWLDFATPEAIGWAPVADPRPEPADRWGTARLTATCSAALATAARLARQFEAETVSVGMVALGLVADPATAAAMALTGGRRDRHPALVAAIQEAVVGMDLGALSPTIEESPRSQRRTVRRDVNTADSGVSTIEDLGELAGRSGFEVLRFAVANLDDEQLELRYQRLLLDAAVLDSVHPVVRGLGGPSAQEIVARARDRFDTKPGDVPDSRQLIVAATYSPGEQIGEALRLLGLSATTVAFEAADADARRRPGDNPSGGWPYTWTVVNALVSVVASFFIARYAWTTDQWWTLLFIWLVWTGHPLTTVVLAGGLWWATDSAAATCTLIVALADYALTRAERRKALLRTGIVLSIGQLRTHSQLGKASQAHLPTRLVRWRRRQRQLMMELAS